MAVRAEEVQRLTGTLRYLYGLERFGIKPGLERVRSLLDAIGRPEGACPAVHIAGTNGKGSTAAMLASIFSASGYRTGLYASPHLVSFNERIRVNGRPIPGREIERTVRRLRPVAESAGATFFEVTTAVAFRHFAESGCDVAVVETGLGGRFDATNVVCPELSVITNIALDHTQQLGGTTRSIAFEKAGIIKRGVPCLSGAEDPAAVSVLRREASSKGSEFIEAGRISEVKQVDSSLDGCSLRISTPVRLYRDLRVSLGGRHQARNAQIAVLAAEFLGAHMGFGRIREATMRSGLKSVRARTGFRGRLDTVSADPPVILDVAHNPAAMEIAVASLRDMACEGGIALFGVMKDKDYAAMLDTLSGFSRLIVAVTPGIQRALPSSRIVAYLHGKGIRALDGGPVARGMELALAERRGPEPVIAIGSHYVGGEVLEYFEARNGARRRVCRQGHR